VRGHLWSVPNNDDRQERGRLRLRHSASVWELREIRRRVARWAGQNRLPDDAVIDLQLAVGEAVANGVEHAYRENAAEVPTVEVDLELRARGALQVVAVTVVDHGRWRPVRGRPRYRGRGLALIERLSRQFQVSTSGHGTRVCFEIPLHRLKEYPVG
jgi:anti-sigma regulatory factor (Ser/Thr protein kinase)